MTRKSAKRKAQSGPAQSAKGNAQRGRIVLAAAIVVALAAGGYFVLNRAPRTLDVSADPFPAPRQALAAPVASSEFVGSERCAECHRVQADAWRWSTHARAGGAPGRVNVIAPFDGTPIRFADAEVIPLSSGGRFTFTVKQAGAEDRVFTVDGVVGGGHMEGGGTQGFLSRYADGT